MAINPSQLILEQAKSFAALHLRQGSRELLEMHETCILDDGVVRECAVILSDLGGGTNYLGLAISIFEDAAVKFAAENAS